MADGDGGRRRRSPVLELFGRTLPPLGTQLRPLPDQRQQQQRQQRRGDEPADDDGRERALRFGADPGPAALLVAPSYHSWVAGVVLLLWQSMPEQEPPVAGCLPGWRALQE